MKGYENTYHSDFMYGIRNQYTTYNNHYAFSRGEGNGLVGFLRLRCQYRISPALGMFVSGNLGINYVAPWYMLGLQYYPFKNRRL